MSDPDMELYDLRVTVEEIGGVRSAPSAVT
jgi:hypothetical protein